MPDKPRPIVSIIIKALNEERHVASAIESALAALDGMEGEIILADSASTDFVEISYKDLSSEPHLGSVLRSRSAILILLQQRALPLPH